MISINDQVLTVREITGGKINENIYSPSELFVLNLVKQWETGVQSFTFQTSGSTGIPKRITFAREQLEYSAQATMSYLDASHTFQKMLLCINPAFIGGAMVVIRSLVAQMDLTVVTADAIPLKKINRKFDMASFVPLQIHSTLKEDPELFQKVDTILIGGAHLEPHDLAALRKIPVRAYQTFGMTETASHFALMDLHKEHPCYEIIGDAEIADGNGCLKVKGTITNHQWLQTNDVVELLNQKQFIWKGRADFQINSGGYKIQPEAIESHLRPLIAEPLLITSRKDERLGERVVLVLESPPRNVDDAIFNQLHPYERPKEIAFLPAFRYTGSGKIDRIATKKLLEF